MTTLDKYMYYFGNLRRGATIYGPAPHKLILLLAVITEAESGHLCSNKLQPCERLIDIFQTLWKEYVHTSHHATFALPFFHLQGEGFWYLHAYPHKEDWLYHQSSVSSLRVLQTAVEYASIAPELYELLQESESRSALKQVLLSELKSSGHSSNGSACPFCALPVDREIVAENKLALAFPDRFPVSTGHTLIIPKRHVASYFDLESAELSHIHDLCITCKDILLCKYHPDGFNVGVNVGHAAGQSIFHCHVHLIPRYHGDVANPRGGVRAVIPGKQDYGCSVAP